MLIKTVTFTILIANCNIHSNNTKTKYENPNLHNELATPLTTHKNLFFDYAMHIDKREVKENMVLIDYYTDISMCRY